MRVALSSGTEIPIPSASYETIDYKSPEDYAEDSEKDTPAKHVGALISQTFQFIVQNSFTSPGSPVPVHSPSPPPFLLLLCFSDLCVLLQYPALLLLSLSSVFTRLRW